jgi:hypothetical protein
MKWKMMFGAMEGYEGLNCQAMIDGIGGVELKYG